MRCLHATDHGGGCAGVRQSVRREQETFSFRLPLNEHMSCKKCDLYRWDACEVRLSDPCPRVVPCVSRLPLVFLWKSPLRRSLAQVRRRYGYCYRGHASAARAFISPTSTFEQARGEALWERVEAGSGSLGVASSESAAGSGRLRACGC